MKTSGIWQVMNVKLIIDRFVVKFIPTPEPLSIEYAPKKITFLPLPDLSIQAGSLLAYIPRDMGEASFFPARCMQNGWPVNSPASCPGERAHSIRHTLPDHPQPLQPPRIQCHVDRHDHQCNSINRHPLVDDQCLDISRKMVRTGWTKNK